MITKVEMTNNRIFLEEENYTRFFHMAEDGCWDSMCEFTGSRTDSDTEPGRRTKTASYLTCAKRRGTISSSDSNVMFYDEDSNTDFFLYKDDYMSYMTPNTGIAAGPTGSLNFAGTIDWAVDLQEFTDTQTVTLTLSRPLSNIECIIRRDLAVNTGSFCAFTCSFGYCPDQL